MHPAMFGSATPGDPGNPSDPSFGQPADGSIILPGTPGEEGTEHPHAAQQPTTYTIGQVAQ